MPNPLLELPEGFATALAQDPAAYDAFGRLPQSDRTHYVTRAYQVSSKAEMQALVSELGRTHTL